MMLWIELIALACLGLFLLAVFLGLIFMIVDDSDAGFGSLVAAIFIIAIGFVVEFGIIELGNKLWHDDHPPSAIPPNCARVVIGHHQETHYVLVGKVLVPQTVTVEERGIICSESGK